MPKSDSGGIGAKKGFLYQDYVAAFYALMMLYDKSAIAIRCEVSDDIDIVYDDRIEYIQVKTTAADRSWQLGELTKVSSKPPKTGGKRKIHNKDSIIHKSLDCDSDDLPGYFCIVSPRDVAKKLSYLKCPFNERSKIDGRDALLKSLKSKLKRYKSANGNDVEYWLDHAKWVTIPSIEYIELQAFKLITTIAYEYYGIYLEPTRHPERILNDLLTNLIKKSATSIALRSSDNKIYNREDFTSWFKGEIEHYGASSNPQVKIYTVDKKKLTAILSTFFEDDARYDFDGYKQCRGLKGSYHRNEYKYDAISNGIIKWLPEVLLRPNEIADQSAEKLEDKIRLYTSRKKQSLSAIEELITKVLLHSTIRTQYNSQPIPAHLYIDDDDNSSFDNIHIILNEHQPDALLMGFSYLIDKDIPASISSIVKNFDALLESKAFSSRNEKILEDKEDGYLLKHDIDDILSPNTSLDEHLSRFKFAFFLGYETDILQCNSKDMANDYVTNLKAEVSSHFEDLINTLTRHDQFFESLNISVYLYPIPSIEALKTLVSNNMGEL